MADSNGYTATYECTSGGANCNVDVNTLVAQTCDQIIETASAWSTINWSNTVICLRAGDHSAKGTLTIGSSGTSGTRKILRGITAGGAVCPSDPWNQTSSNRVLLEKLNFDGDAYWVVGKGLYVSDATEDFTPLIYLHSGASNNIFDGLLIDGQFGSNSEGLVFVDESSNDNVFQNLVIRRANPDPGEQNCFLTGGGSTNVWLVNSELYDGTKQVFTYQNSSAPGLVLENNDMYMSTDYYTDCSGNDNDIGPCSKGENIISLKSHGGSSASSNPTRIIHNRIWGARQTDSAYSGGSGTQGDLVDYCAAGSPDSVEYVLFQDNIVFDGQNGFLSSCPQDPRNHNLSFIGNIWYDMQQHKSGTETSGWRLERANTSEWYLNTVVRVARSGTDFKSFAWSDATNHDIRGNVFIDSGPPEGSPGAGSLIDYNVYYETTNSGETNKIVNTISTRANSTAYSQGAIIRTTATPPATGAAGDFLYMCTVAGTSASSSPTFTTTLGNTTADGTVTWQAIRGPYSFYRKLRTGEELMYIPYAVPFSTAPEAAFVPATIGSVSSVGINNDTASW